MGPTKRGSNGPAPQARRGPHTAGPRPHVRPAGRGPPRPPARHPRPRDGARDRLPVRARRADARRQRPAEPGHVRDDLDGAPGPPADVRDVRQEHDRQGRVPAHRRARAAVREHAQPAVELARRGAGHGHVDHRVERGGDARRDGAQVAVARSPAGRRQADRPAQHGDGRQRAGVLGEVLPLLGGRAPARAHGGRAVPPHRRPAPSPHCDENTIGVVRRAGLDVRRVLRAGRRHLRRARPPPGRDRARRPGARRRRVGRVRRPVHRPRPRVGLPPPPGAVDQRLGPQVRARVPGRRLGDLAQPRRAARGPGVPRQLPGRRHAHVRPQLLPAGQPGGGAVLQLHAPRLRRLPAGPADLPRRRPATRPTPSPSSARSA